MPELRLLAVDSWTKVGIFLESSFPRPWYFDHWNLRCWKICKCAGSLLGRSWTHEAGVRYLGEGLGYWQRWNHRFERASCFPAISMTPCPRRFEGRRHLGMKSGTAKNHERPRGNTAGTPYQPFNCLKFCSFRKQSGLENRLGLASWGKTSESPHPSTFTSTPFPYGSVSILVWEQRRFWSSTCRMTSFVCTLAVQTSEGIVPTINNVRDKFDCASWLTRFAIFTFCIASFHFVSTFNIWLLGSRVVEIEHIRHRIWNRPRWWFHMTGILMSTAPLWKVQMLARWPWRRWGNFASVMMRTNVSQSVQPVYICSFFSPFEMLLRSAKECWPVDAVHPRRGLYKLLACSSIGSKQNYGYSTAPIV